MLPWVLGLQSFNNILNFWYLQKKSKISTKCLRDNISYISQNPYIFADTLRNNITLENKNITINALSFGAVETKMNEVWERNN